MYDKFSEFIKDKQHICIIQAENPDGDSLGSALALEDALVGKETKIYALLRGLEPRRYRVRLEG